MTTTKKDKKHFLLLVLSITLFTFFSCSKNEEQPEDNLVIMSFYAYTKYDTSSIPEKTSAKFFLFDASNGQQYKEERINIPTGSYFDYSEANCEMITLLKHNEFELKDGTRVKPIIIDGSYYISIIPDFKKPDTWSHLLSHNTMKIPTGKYYVVALNGNWDSGWADKDKYSGKYITVSNEMVKDDKTISIEFPHDGKHKGYIDWITTNW